MSDEKRVNVVAQEEKIIHDLSNNNSKQPSKQPITFQNQNLNNLSSQKQVQLDLNQ
jgi:hypothetical protein